jgi:hypothetical protein
VASPRTVTGCSGASRARRQRRSGWPGMGMRRSPGA